MNNSEIEAIVRTVIEKVADGQSKSGATSPITGNQPVGGQVAANGGLVQTTMTLEKATKLIEKHKAPW